MRLEFVQNGKQIVVGWDDMLQTFFGQVFDKSLPEDKQVVKWIGAVDYIGSVDQLEKMLRPEVNRIPKEIREQLYWIEID